MGLILFLLIYFISVSIFGWLLPTSMLAAMAVITFAPIFCDTEKEKWFWIIGAIIVFTVINLIHVFFFL